METLRLLPWHHPFFSTSNKSPTIRNPNSHSSRIVRCFYFYPWRPHFHMSSSNWHWDSKNSESEWTGRVRFSFRDEWTEEDEEGDVGFRWKNKRRRRWWDEYDSRDVDEEGSGVLEEAIDSIWIFKVFRNFGWMLPAIIISMLLATGPKAFLMALALPLGQSILSFAFDKLFGRTRDRPKPRARAQKKPFGWATSNVDGREEEQEENSATTNGRQGYQSWVATDDGSVKKGDHRGPGFGGWDELDRRRESGKGPMRRSPRTTGAPPGQGLEKGKLSSRGRHSDTPLLIRLLIAVFPFLGSWTKLL